MTVLRDAVEAQARSIISSDSPGKTNAVAKINAEKSIALGKKITLRKYFTDGKTEYSTRRSEYSPKRPGHPNS